MTAPSGRHEVGRQLEVPDRHGDSVGSVHAKLLRYRPGGVRNPFVVGDADKCVVDPARMLEVEAFLAQDLRLRHLKAVIESRVRQ